MLHSNDFDKRKVKCEGSKKEMRTATKNLENKNTKHKNARNANDEDGTSMDLNSILGGLASGSNVGCQAFQAA